MRNHTESQGNRGKNLQDFAIRLPACNSTGGGRDSDWTVHHGLVSDTLCR